MSFLDYDGFKYFYGKLKSLIDSKFNGLENKFLPKESMNFRDVGITIKEVDKIPSTGLKNGICSYFVNPERGRAMPDGAGEYIAFTYFNIDNNSSYTPLGKRVTQIVFKVRSTKRYQRYGTIKNVNPDGTVDANLWTWEEYSQNATMGDLENKIDKTAITDKLDDTSQEKVLSQRAGFDLKDYISTNYIKQEILDNMLTSKADVDKALMKDRDKASPVTMDLNDDKSYTTPYYVGQAVGVSMGEHIESIAESMNEELVKKVDKVDGKALSTNDYDNVAKAKVDAIPADPKYTDTIPDLSGYAKKDEIKTKVLKVDEYADILTNNSFENYYLNTKIESNVGWNKEFFPRGVYFYRMIDHTDAPEDRNDFIVMTAYNATVDVFYDDIQLHSRIVEQVAISLNTGRIYERYIDREDKSRPLNIEYGTPSDDSCDVHGIRGRWTNWIETTENFATKDEIKRIFATKDEIKKFKEQIILTQAEYDALTTEQKNDESKIYFIKE